MTGVIVTVVAVVVSGVIVRCVIVSGMRIERRCWLLVPVGLIDIGVRVRWVIVAERDAFEIAGRAANGFSLTKRNIVWWLAFKDEVSRLFGRQRLMTAEPYNERTIHHLYGTVFCGPFDVFVDFTGASRANAPPSGAIEITWNHEAPSREQALPRRYFNRDSIFHALERVVDSPVVLGVFRFGWWTGSMGIGRMVVISRGGVLWTLSQRSIPN